MSLKKVLELAKELADEAQDCEKTAAEAKQPEASLYYTGVATGLRKAISALIHKYNK